MGYKLSGGERIAWEFIPMIGGVVGDTWGIAPGYRESLGWWRLEFSSEGEYVFDTRDVSGSFFSELSLAPVD